LPGHGDARIRDVGAEGAGADRNVQVTRESRAVRLDVSDRRLDRLGHADTGALDLRRRSAIPATEADRPGEFGRDEVQLLAGSCGALDVVIPFGVGGVLSEVGDALPI